jgi:hypothetical protein
MVALHTGHPGGETEGDSLSSLPATPGAAGRKAPRLALPEIVCFGRVRSDFYC